jgi:hypothetical protein
MKDVETRALNWLIKNHDGLRNYLDGMHGPFSDEKADLEDIIRESEKQEKDIPLKANRSLFLVAIDTDKEINGNTVKHYVSRALKRFPKYDDQKALYEGPFGFMHINKARMYVTDIPVMKDPQDFRTTLLRVKRVESFLSRTFREIEPE